MKWGELSGCLHHDGVVISFLVKNGEVVDTVPFTKTVLQNHTFLKMPECVKISFPASAGSNVSAPAPGPASQFLLGVVVFPSSRGVHLSG